MEPHELTDTALAERITALMAAMHAAAAARRAGEPGPRIRPIIHELATLRNERERRAETARRRRWFGLHLRLQQAREGIRHLREGITLRARDIAIRARYRGHRPSEYHLDLYDTIRSHRHPDPVQRKADEILAFLLPLTAEADLTYIEPSYLDRDLEELRDFARDTARARGIPATKIP
ncbi:hypothetical protein [Microbacterium indicum]|uniref:hypothetical protein n=1 Tax=Microbacterium indicum TaxID=358100 RepID=UPI00049045DF|nr:hypothetical protein [Microbacterium indicum]